MPSRTRVLLATGALVFGALAFVGCPGGGLSLNGWVFPLGEYVDIGQRIFALQDGNYFIAGSGENTQTTDLLSSAALISSTGTLLWGQLFADLYAGGYYGFVSGCPLSNSAFAIAGPDYADRYGIGTAELRVVKLDAEGEVLWDRRYGREQIDPRDMADSGDGGCVIAGTRTFMTLQAANKTYTYTERLFLRKLDVNGDIVWDRSYESPVGVGIERIKPVSDGGYVMVGASALIVRVDQEGNTLWWQGIGWNMTLTGVSETSDGGFVAVGTAATNNPRPAVIRLDAAGNVLWTVYGADIVPLEQLDQYDVRDGLVDNEGRIVMVGQATIVRYVGNFFPIITNGGFVMQLDPDGKLLWNKSVDSAYEINGIALTRTGDYITTGTDGNHTQALRIGTHGNVR